MTKPRDDISAEYVRSALDYDPETGLLTWRVRADLPPQWNGKFAGKIAGMVNDHGYVVIAIKQRDYRAHRLAWVIMTGEWPTHDVDHIDGNRSANQWLNLRAATRSENTTNGKVRSTNRSGFKGVSLVSKGTRWRARVEKDGRLICINGFKTPEAAYEAYVRMARELHGKFARVA